MIQICWDVFHRHNKCIGYVAYSFHIGVVLYAAYVPFSKNEVDICDGKSFNGDVKRQCLA